MSAITLIGQANSNRYLAKALTAVPEYQHAVDIRAAALQARDQLPAAPTPPDPTSGPGIEKWLTAVWSAGEQQRRYDTQRAALTGLISRCENQLDSTLFVLGDRLLSSLHTDLNDLMTETASVAQKLKGATSASQAITAGAADPWAKLLALRDRYDHVRAAARLVWGSVNPLALTDAGSPYTESELASDLVVANLDDVVPGWRRPDTRITVSGQPPRRLPWTDAPVEQLLWLATSEARAWVPTTDQLEALQAQRRAAANPDPVVIHGRTDLRVNA